METVARWVLNLFFSSIITFYGSLLLLFLFRPLIKSPRALYIFYLLPLFKTASDALFSSHENWVFLSGESILKQPENSRILSALVGYEGTYPFVSLKFHLENGHLFSIGDVISESFSPILSMGLSCLIIIGSCIALARFVTRINMSVHFSQRIKKELIYWKTIKRIPVYLTHEPQRSPFILGIWKPMIVFPTKLASQLTQEEKEAILMHEVGHALWKDNFIQWVILFIHALLWFIPFKSKWLKKACHYRELGCDERCNQEALAGAIYKTEATSLPPIGIAFSTSFDRFQRALHRKQSGRITIYLSFMILLGGGTLIFLSQFLPF